MLPSRLIAVKRDGGELSDEEIAFFIRGFTNGEIPDYQMSAMAMAICLRGMSPAEVAALTTEMLRSGTVLSWPDDGIPRVDKHSTGGVGDKTSLIIAPILAECGLRNPMLSGRGLGATGGTLDKLESIPGFRTDLSLEEMTRLTLQIGCVITGASQELAPADRKLYALRDVTGTVESIPLITASIMSKKLAESLNALVLDVKFGSGAFMKSSDRATELATLLVRTGQHMGVRTVALLTDMNQPLGRMCGNLAEVMEAIDVLQGNGPADVRLLSIELAAELLLAAGVTSNVTDAFRMCSRVIDNGAAFERFEKMVAAQGGRLKELPSTAPATEVPASSAGIVASINTEQLGLALIGLGCGRAKMEDRIDHTSGMEMLVRIGDRVDRGTPLVRIFSRHPRMSEEIVRSADVVRSAFQITDSQSQVAAPPLIVRRIRD